MNSIITSRYRCLFINIYFVGTGSSVLKWYGKKAAEQARVPVVVEREFINVKIYEIKMRY